MTADEFVAKLTELMDTDAALNLSTKLSDVSDWDSLSMVAFFSWCKTTLTKKISPDDIKSASTVGDLFRLTGGDAS